MEYLTAAKSAKSLQSYPTLCNPIDGSPPCSAVLGILQARTLEWVTISFSNARKWKVKVKSLSRVWLLVTPWTAAHQGPPSMGFARQEWWSGLPLPSLKDSIGTLFELKLKLPIYMWPWCQTICKRDKLHYLSSHQNVSFYLNDLFQPPLTIFLYSLVCYSPGLSSSL